MGSLAAMLCSMAFFQKTPEAVPVRQEPMHHLKYENEFVRVFDVVIPAGRSTLVHAHDQDYVFVTLGASHVRSEPASAPPTDLRLEDGETRFTKAPLVHRATNLASAPFRNLTIEILHVPDASPDPLPPVPAGYSLVLENERVRVSRLVLEPEQSVEMHAHALRCLHVVVAPSKLLESSVEGKTATAEMKETKAGDFQWRAAKRRHSVKNLGSARFEAVVIEWK